MAKKETNTDKLKIQYYKSVIGYSKKQKAAVKALGLTKLNQIVEKPDDASMRGVVKKLPHILRIVE